MSTRIDPYKVYSVGRLASRYSEDRGPDGGMPRGEVERRAWLLRGGVVVMDEQWVWRDRVVYISPGEQGTVVYDGHWVVKWYFIPEEKSIPDGDDLFFLGRWLSGRNYFESQEVVEALDDEGHRGEWVIE